MTEIFAMPSSVQNALMAIMADPKKMHDFFIHCRKEYAPENFCAYYMIEAYKSGPRKRMANFIIDNYMKSDGDAVGEYGTFTAQLNLTLESGGKINNNNVKEKAAQMKATYAKVGTTFLEKAKLHGIFGAIKMKSTGSTKPSADLFAELQSLCETNLFDTYNRFSTNPAGQGPDGGGPLFKFIKAITVAGWTPVELGIWN